MAITDAPAPETPQPRKPFLQKILPFTTVGVIVALLYVAWVFYSRHQSDVEAERASAAKEQEQRQQTVNAVFGNGEITFASFSADRAILKRGEHTQLCYGVENAKTVKVDPPVPGGDLKPSYHNCVEIAPTKTTIYKITAEDGKGHSKSEELTVQVQ